MLSDIYLYSIGLCATLLVYWSAPSSNPRLRQSVLLTGSAILVLLYSPGGFAVCGYLVGAVLLYQEAVRRLKHPFMFWVGVIAAIAPLVLLRLYTDQNMMISFGVAFATVKTIGMMMTAYSGRIRIAPVEAGLLIYFFPLFSVGPVEKLRTFQAETFTRQFAFDDVLNGVQRIIVGLFILQFVCNDFLSPFRNDVLGRDTAALEAMDWSTALALVYVSFLFTYLNFTGFSEVAIGSCRLFGMRVVENFDWPLLAGNVAAFWKRYHISMGDWINQFLYFPIAVFLRHSWGHYVAIVTAFVLFGMWHAFTWQYLIWGLGNGSAVALCHFTVRNKISTDNWSPAFRPVRYLIWPVSLTFVGLMQTIGNLNSFPDAMLLLGKLFGLE